MLTQLHISLQQKNEPYSNVAESTKFFYIFLETEGLQSKQMALAQMI
jgi:hypothetical protein